MNKAHTKRETTPNSGRPTTQTPYRVGERVDGTSWVCSGQLSTERPERFEDAEIVQVGCGYAGVDADEAYVWVRLADHTERQARVRDVTKSVPVGVSR